MESHNILSQKKPVKPHPDFPLFPHSVGQWAKKVRYKMHYFGPWDDPQGALQRWLDQRADLLAGREPYQGGLTVHDLIDKFIASRAALVESGEISVRHLADCKRVGVTVDTAFAGRMVTDLRPYDFEKLRKVFAATHGAEALSGDIAKTKAFFNFGQELIDKPIKFGNGFKKPSAAAMRKARSERGSKMFLPKQIRLLLREAKPQLRAMILLAINCGFGNNDCALLQWKHLDLKKGWVDYARPKTGVDRRCRLWPETVAALKGFKTTDYVFVTKYGNPWIPKSVSDNPISNEMSKLLKKLKLHRPGIGFYALRHTFETVAGESKDQVAVDFIMGHVPASKNMSARYRQRMLNKRIFDVVKHVRHWLKPALAFRPLPAGSCGTSPSLRLECGSVAAH
jgi:integrase